MSSICINNDERKASITGVNYKFVYLDPVI
jgi:hypothetical protein